MDVVGEVSSMHCCCEVESRMKSERVARSWRDGWGGRRAAVRAINEAAHKILRTTQFFVLFEANEKNPIRWQQVGRRERKEGELTIRQEWRSKSTLCQWDDFF